MRAVTVNELSIVIHRITLADFGAVLEIYRQCEDFLVLGWHP
jgi:hypothetical protein